MDFVILILVSFAASWLTFLCGFGLGTLLTPVFFMLFKDLPLAIAGTTFVHFGNNVFKFFLMKKSIDWSIVKPFMITAIPAAFIGAMLVDEVNNIALFSYVFMKSEFTVNLLNLCFGIILILFSLVELIPSWRIAFAKKSLWLGGLISGFFGGFSGHQGALRTAFLIKYNLKKETFIASGIVVALVIDVVRSTVYLNTFDLSLLSEKWVLILSALLAALVGAILGKLFLKKIKLPTLNFLVAIAMLLFGFTLGAGILMK